MKPTDYFLRGTLALTLAIHALGFVPGLRLSLDLVWPFALLPLAALVITLGTFFKLPRREYKARLKQLPWWVRWGGPLFGLYSIGMGLNQMTSQGRPKALASGFVLAQHGQVIRTLSDSEYWQLARAEVTFIFGSLLWFACDALIDRTVAKMSSTAYE